MSDDSEICCKNSDKVSKKRCRLFSLTIVAVASTMWFAIRTGTKPSRIMYPCQQAALANVALFKAIASASIPSLASLRVSTGWMKPVLVLTILSVGGFVMAAGPVHIGFETQQVDSNLGRVPIVLTPQTAVIPASASDLFYIQNATGPDGNMTPSMAMLINLMAEQGLYFYNTTGTPEGLIGSNDVIILKINSQWDYRGGTNTDLIKSLISTIVEHPEGFTGEIVIADNGQGLGSMAWYDPNSFYHNQSAQNVADFFSPEWNVSSICWDDFRDNTVEDYDDEDITSGYVRSSVWDDDTQIFVSYPKFLSAAGTYISFKNGVWNNDTGFDSDRLKIINMPVLKTHFRYGVTGCIKHYMGVPQGYIVPSVDPGIPHEHFSIADGGMGTLMAETRAPILNILDMIWVNAHPLESSSQTGPWSIYASASATDIIAASQDPVALDYWSAKHVLIPTAEYLNYTSHTSLDPDNDTIHENAYHQQIEQDESFHTYLELSMNELSDAGFQVTMNETEMSVFVTVMTDPGPVTPTTPTAPAPLNLLPIAIGAIALGVVIVATVVFKRRAS